MPGAADESTAGSFMADVPKGDTRQFLFADAKSIADGCNPTRYEIRMQNATTRVGRVKPTCSFTFTKIAGADPQGSLPVNPGCNQPWNLSAKVLHTSQGSKTLALRDTQDGRNVLGSVSVEPALGFTTATISAPFRGWGGTFGLTFTDAGPAGSMAPPPSTQNAWKVNVARACTVDLGGLE